MSMRYYRLIFFYLSIFVMLIGGIQLLPLLVLPFYPEEISYASCFVIPGITAIFFGYLLRYFFKDSEIVKLEKNYDSFLVVLIWISAILISTVPWILKGDYNFTQAVFEMTSGYSTTGLSVVDVDHTPHIFLMFRSITLFVGGVGLVLIITSAFSDRYGINLYHAEGHSDRLMPNLVACSRLILSIYSLYILFGTLAYILSGMKVFDAINTSIAALSTGGFGVIGESIYGYHSLSVEVITIVLMLLGQTNFMIHLYLFRRKFGKIWRHCETKFLLSLVLIFLPLMCYDLLSKGYAASLGESFRISIFQFVSCVTTTGFSSVKDLALLPAGFQTIMILMMLVGGNQESTGGGIKQYRVIVVLKGIYYSIKEAIMNPRMVTTHYIYRTGKKEVLEKDEISSTTTYVFFYILLFFLGSLIFTMGGYSLQDSMLEFSSALSTVGLSVGITGYSASKIILWTAIVGMFLGRLEIMVVFKAILRGSADIRKREY
ncbi:MAG: TrkH family potassium uptake protein [Erysipelotrichaceae bacterium]|nr:TrkH family potassium uptake protein [Erysipelotrichaceae bacterium]